MHALIAVLKSCLAPIVDASPPPRDPIDHTVFVCASALWLLRAQ